MTPARPHLRDDRLGYWLLAVVGLLAWLLRYPYLGLFHDANLYALQALARLEPESLAHDVFLSHGSQDRFTLFSPLYAGVIARIGLDHAAALLTLLSQAGLCLAAWQLARSFVPPRAAAAGVVLLLALPAEYGPLRIFSCLESFLTPRMAAEALILGALAAATRNHRSTAAALAALALLLHPVMALAGIGVGTIALLLQLWQSGARGRALGIAGLLLGVGLGGALLIGGRFDADWLSIVTARSPYLFLRGWQSEDLSRAVSGLVPLAAGALVLESPLRRACLGVLMVTVAGWALTLLGADLLHAVLITQAQPWRIEWLACVANALLLPYLLTVLWRGDAGRRSAALLIVAALIFNTQAYAMPIGLAALVLLGLPPLPSRHARWVLLGAGALCVLAVLWRVASDLEFTDVHYLNAALPLWLRRTMSFVKDGTALGALLLAVTWLDALRSRSVGQSLLFIIGSVIAVGAARFTLGDWVAQAYPPERIAAFESWRIRIPPQAQVFWNDAPLSAWALLQRAHYISGLQSSGVVFSESGARELQHRAEQLSPAIAAANFLQWDFIGPQLPANPATLRTVCGLGVIDYLVTEADIGLEPLGVLTTLKGSRQTLRLYRCAGLSQG